MNSHKIGFWQLFILALLLNFAAQLIHEAGHWAVYQAYGRGPVWGYIGIVQLWNSTPLQPEDWVKTSSSAGEQGWLRLASPVNSKLEELGAAAAGPLASLLAAVLGLFLLRQSKETATKLLGLMLSLVTSFVMSFYYLRSPLRAGGDEYGIAIQLGLSRFAIEIPFALAFLVCLILGLRELHTWKTRLQWLAIILLSGIPTGLALNYADGLVRAGVNLGNPLFQPVFGFSLPVLITDSLVLLGLWLWWRTVRKSAFMPR